MWCQEDQMTCSYRGSQAELNTAFGFTSFVLQTVSNVLLSFYLASPAVLVSYFIANLTQCLFLSKLELGKCETNSARTLRDFWETELFKVELTRDCGGNVPVNQADIFTTHKLSSQFSLFWRRWKQHRRREPPPLLEELDWGSYGGARREPWQPSHPLMAFS